jgi:iron(III) transport system ATP-binding protein
MTAETTELAIQCRSVTKRYGSLAALDDFDLEVPTGSILGLLGPSGSGKTTALRIIAGFEQPDAGSVEVAGREVVGADTVVPPEDRKVGMVFQEYALFPHLTVADNVAYGLSGRMRGQRTGEVLELVGLTEAGNRMPHELSGGEQQRVALARALAPEPHVILLDEPFSNLDAPRRDRVRREVRTILVEARTTAVFVTHDQEEALAMSDAVAVMRDGRVVQVAEPSELYRRPGDCWVARFLGEAEFIDGFASEGSVETALGTFPLEGDNAKLVGKVEVMIRPESVGLVPDPDATARVVAREFYGHDQLVMVRIDDGIRLLSRLGATPSLLPGERVDVSINEVVAFPVAEDHRH